MSTNLELKARCKSFRRASGIAEALCRRRSAVLKQTDTYFLVPQGRLKLREIAGHPSELIWYQRPDKAGAKISDYRIAKVRNPKQLCAILGKLFGILVTVRKVRHLYLHKNARIHLDRVSGLGEFIEFEVVVRKGMPQAKRLMASLVSEFGIQRRNRIPLSYSNLLLNHPRRSP